jgi:hypothetical protein
MDFYNVSGRIPIIREKRKLSRWYLICRGYRNEKVIAMENINPLVEVLMYFGIGLFLAFVVIPLFIMATSKSRK